MRSLANLFPVTITLITISLTGAFIIPKSSGTQKKAFIASIGCPARQPDTSLGPGGWGIGTPIDMQDEEYSNGRNLKRRRRKGGSSPSSSSSTSIDDVAYSTDAAERAANKYELEDAVSFTKRIQSEKDNLQMQKKKDLMEIAKMAGLGDRLKPKANAEAQDGRYGKFEDSFDLDEEDDNLDVRVY